MSMMMDGAPAEHIGQTNYCGAAELLWDAARAESFRQMMRDALGRDCICEPGEPCGLLEGAVVHLHSLLDPQRREKLDNYAGELLAAQGAGR
jgi:hypothetical protein